MFCFVKKRNSSFGHLTPEVLERYAAHGLTVLRTGEHKARLS
jgi:beta-lactamase superfamily II metal-dependent hydrolase